MSECNLRGNYIYEMNHEQLVHIIRSPRSGKNYMRPPFSLFQVQKSPFHWHKHSANVSSQTATVYNLCDHHNNLHILFMNALSVNYSIWIMNSIIHIPRCIIFEILVQMGVNYAWKWIQLRRSNPTYSADKIKLIQHPKDDLYNAYPNTSLLLF